jgi:hypothetical protein
MEMVILAKMKVVSNLLQCEIYHHNGIDFGCDYMEN